MKIIILKILTKVFLIDSFKKKISLKLDIFGLKNPENKVESLTNNDLTVNNILF